MPSKGLVGVPVGVIEGVGGGSLPRANFAVILTLSANIVWRTLTILPNCGRMVAQARCGATTAESWKKKWTVATPQDGRVLACRPAQLTLTGLA